MEEIKRSVLWSSKAWQRWIDYVCECLGMRSLQRFWKLLHCYLLLNIVVIFQCKEPSNQTYMETLMYFKLSVVQFSLYLNPSLANTCLGDMITSCLIKILVFFLSLLIYVFLKITISSFAYGEVTMVLRMCLLHLWCEMSPFLNPKRFCLLSSLAQ